MLGFQTLILNLFIGLTFMFPQDYAANKKLQVSTPEEVISTGNHQSAAIIDSNLYLNQLLDTSQNSELPFTRPFESVTETPTVAYGSKLLYLSIGNAIDLEFTSTTMIFPFHWFT